MTDGGLDYHRWGAKDMSRVENLCEYVPVDTFLWGVLDRETGMTTAKRLDALEDSHIQNICLHLRKRYAPIQSEHDDEYHNYRALRHRKDNELLDEHFLPELEARGLVEVTEEIPWEKPNAASENVT
jgi:hypothetical protein